MLLDSSWYKAGSNVLHGLHLVGQSIQQCCNSTELQQYRQPVLVSWLFHWWVTEWRDVTVWADSSKLNTVQNVCRHCQSLLCDCVHDDTKVRSGLTYFDDRRWNQNVGVADLMARTQPQDPCLAGIQSQSTTAQQAINVAGAGSKYHLTVISILI